jgi:multidrug efflux pump subunit AcrA (membrane-fusion protein)
VATEILVTTSTKRVVTVDLETSKSRLAQRGADVTVEMPDGKDVEGSIAKVGSIATREQNEDGSEGDATIEVTINLRGRGTKAIDQAPVDVQLEQERAEDVLTVPVTALLSQSGGGFAVEVVEGASTRLVPVEPGLSTEGDVEIEGEGLEAGMKVTDARV